MLFFANKRSKDLKYYYHFGTAKPFIRKTIDCVHQTGHSNGRPTQHALCYHMLIVF